MATYIGTAPSGNIQVTIEPGHQLTLLKNFYDGSRSVTLAGDSLDIDAESNTRYICADALTDLAFTPCASGICDIIFESGSTVTLLTVPDSVKWPSWFNPAALETNTIYELNVMDGIYGTVMSWPS